MKLRFLGAACAAAALAVAPAAASAATDTTSVTLAAGQLTFATSFTAGDFPTTTLNGLVQTVNAATNAWSVNDATGSALGWNVKIRASQFSTGGTTPKTLPEGSMSYVGVSTGDITAGAGQALTLAPVPVAAAAAIDSASGTNDQMIAKALVGTGQGQWSFGAKASGLTLVIPPTAEAGTYTSTITTTLTSGLV